MMKFLNKKLLYYFVSLIIIIVYGFWKFIIPPVTEILNKTNEISKLQSDVSQAEKEIKAAMASNVPKDLPVVIYTSPYTGLDVENASVDLVDAFIQTLYETNNRVVELSFGDGTAPAAAPAPPTAQPVASPGDQGMTGSTPNSSDSSSIGSAQALSLNMTLDCSYIALQNLLQRIYSWKYLTSVKNIVVTPDPDNPDDLTAQFSIDLYVNR